MMKVVTNENDLLVAEVIREHLIAIAGDAVVVRAEKFYATGLDFNMVIIILDKMKDASLLDGSYHSWGFLTGKKKDSAWVFEETSRDEPLFYDDPMQGEGEFFSITFNAKYPSPDALIEGIKSLTKKISTTRGVDFNALQRTLRYGDTIHSFQKGRADQTRFNLIKELWDKRALVENRNMKRKGEKTSVETIATRIEVADSSQTYFKKHNAGTRNKMAQLIKNLNTNLRRKGIPLKIKRAGGIQIVVTT